MFSLFLSAVWPDVEDSTSLLITHNCRTHFSKDWITINITRPITQILANFLPIFVHACNRVFRKKRDEGTVGYEIKRPPVSCVFRLTRKWNCIVRRHGADKLVEQKNDRAWYREVMLQKLNFYLTVVFNCHTRRNWSRSTET